LGIGIRHHETEIVPYQRDRLRKLEMLMEQPMDVARHGALVVARKRLRRMAGAAIVGSYNPKASIDKLRYRVAPGPPGLGKAVQQDNGARPTAGDDIMKADARFDVGSCML